MYGGLSDLLASASALPAATARANNVRLRRPDRGGCVHVSSMLSMRFQSFLI